MSTASKRFAFLSAAAMAVGMSSAAQAQVAGGRLLYGVQPATGRIVPVNPATGAVGGGFAVPGTINVTDSAVGLSGALGGTTLIYRNATTGNANSNQLFGINPLTGATVSNNTADGFLSDGLSFEAIGGVNYIYYSHSGVDTHRQTGFGGNTAFGFTAGTPLGGVGGDGLGREFANYTDGTIKEFSPSTGAFVASFTAPAANIQGLAFDGTNLYASTPTGLLYTFSASTGAVLNTVTVQGGALFGLGTAVPEPTTGLAAMATLFGLARRVRRPRG